MINRTPRPWGFTFATRDNTSGLKAFCAHGKISIFNADRDSDEIGHTARPTDGGNLTHSGRTTCVTFCSITTSKPLETTTTNQFRLVQPIYPGTFIIVKDPHPHITIEGKAYPLWKRGAKEGSPWWIRLQAEGVRRSMSTGTSNLAQAKERAAKFVTAAKDGLWHAADDLRVTPPLKRPPTLAKLIDAAKTLPIPSIPIYIRSAIVLLTEALDITEADALKLGVEVFTAPLVRTFQAKRQGRSKTPLLDLITPNNGPTNSTVKNARLLFSRKALAHYDQLGISLPDLVPFLKAPNLAVEVPRYSNNPITDVTLREIDNALAEQPPAVQRLHHAIRCLGQKPTAAADPTASHARFLKQWDITPTTLHQHALASMAKRCSSYQVAAQWGNMTEWLAKWHFEALTEPPRPLALHETYLGK